MRDNFEETQQLRRESASGAEQRRREVPRWWAKDERYFLEEAQLRRGEAPLA